ncbi:hypothetical protein F5I97DRAFT_1806085 [Phlebopus sp. FC_14]|nr:hypothetical protein F5I97DRAFT_1806085 [Phlebopus sp. FC_14]
MHPSLRWSSARAHKPLIKFIGKRVWPSSAGPSHPHPAAPPEYRKSFSEMVPKSSPSSGPFSGEQPAFQDFWDAPSRFWRPKYRELEEVEIDAVLVREQAHI